MKTINLIGNIIVLTVIVSIIYLFLFAGNGQYVAHLAMNN